ncbi:MAG: hypothetical protein GY725_05840 [bacterium]|nr:hypothetical protein [bacterium]
MIVESPEILNPADQVLGNSKETEAWRADVGVFAWPTLALAGLILLAFVGVIAAATSGLIPLWAGWLLNSFVAYAAFTPAHEATHRNICGRHRGLRWLNEACGWLCMSILFDSFAVLRSAHLRHHAHTNDPEKDPDYFIPGSKPIPVLVRCFAIFAGYMKAYFADTERSPHLWLLRGTALAYSLVLVGIAATLAAMGWWREVLALWVLPAPMAFLALALVFDYVPHWPHREQDRYKATRIMLFPGLSTLLLFQNYHLIHHLFPSIPFYRYGACFREIREDLVSKGSSIIGLGSGS